MAVHDIKNHRCNIILACVLLLIGLFSADLYAPSLPTMVIDLATSQRLLRSVIVVYFFGLSLTQLVYGPVSDIIGRKGITLFSLFLIVLFNLLTMTATTGPQLLLCRFFTGLGAGACPVISRAIVRDTFSNEKKLSQGFSTITMVAQISPAVAPILGGWIEQHSIWQNNFLILSILTSLFLIVFSIFFQESNQTKKVHSIKSIAKEYRRLLKNKHFLIYTTMSAMVYAYTVSYYTINPFVYQNHFGFNPLQNGYMYVIYSAGLFLGAYLSKKLLKFISASMILYSGISLLIIITLIFPHFAFEAKAYVLIVYSFFVASLCGAIAPLLISLAVLPFVNNIGVVSALQGSIKIMGTALMLLCLVVYNVDTAQDLILIFSYISISLLVLFLTLLFLKNKDTNHGH